MRALAIAIGMLFALVMFGSPGRSDTTAPALTPTSTPRTTPEFHPGPNFTGGRVTKLVPDGAVLESAGQQFDVTFKLVVDVWKETSVPSTAIEVGDDLSISGTAGSPFVARYVWANIGVIDGTIEAIDSKGMVLDLTKHPGQKIRVDFSPYIEYGAASIRTTPTDLIVGRTVGMVVYGSRVGPPRATRIWLD